MDRARLWIAIVVFVAALTHLIATLDGIHARWVSVVSVVLTVGTLALVIVQWKAGRDA